MRLKYGVEENKIKKREKYIDSLVSIIVITYNSSKYVLETLESAKAQTYKNIELIITDDFSTDNTIAICKAWLDANKNHFIYTSLITVMENTGVPANCNRGIKVANGSWIKLIAGDDILLENCITDNMAFVQKEINIKFLFSKVNYLKTDKNGVSKKFEKQSSINTSFFKENPKRQHQLLVLGDVLIPAPAGFFNTKTLVGLGLFDEEIKLCEDYPMWMNATKNGIQLQFMNVVTVNYRVHNESIINTVNLAYETSMKRVFFKYRLKYLLKFNFFLACNLFIWNSIRTYSNLRKIRPYISPFLYLKYIKNKFKK